MPDNITSLKLVEYDLIRIKWLEDLKLVHLFLFLAHPNADNIINKDAGLVLQNPWAYDQVTKVILADRSCSNYGKSYTRGCFWFASAARKLLHLQHFH